MDVETLTSAGGTGGAVAAIAWVLGKWMDRHKPDYQVRAERSADYQGQIAFLNDQVTKLSSDVAALRAELRVFGVREHKLHRMIHQHCKESPGCNEWFDREFSKIPGDDEETHG